MPAMIPSSVLGRDDKAATSERITVGLIGCGKMANDYHLHELLPLATSRRWPSARVDRTRREHAKRHIEKAYSGHLNRDGRGTLTRAVPGP